MRSLITFTIILLCVPLVYAIYPGDPGFVGCIISNQDGVFNDDDCDRVPDVIDNCPFVANPVQTDVDHNGLGDMCDLVIDEIILEPQEPMQGRSVLVRAGLFNNRPYPMRNMILKTEIPRLGLVVGEPLPIIESGQRYVAEVLIRVPECAPTTKTDFVVFAEYPIAPGEKEVFSNVLSVPVVSSGACPLDPGQDLTVVDIIELQDVNPDVGATYPFTIKNNWPESKSYILTVSGHESWGYVEIHPGSVIVLPPGGSREGALQVYAREGQTGSKSFSLTVQARDDIKQVLLQADIPEPDKNAQQGPQFFNGFVSFIVVLALIVVVLIYLGEHKKRPEKKSSSKKKPKKKRK